jgi:hypothetical protein
MVGAGGALTGLALGFALSACCGFRVFIPLLIAGVSAHVGWVHLGEQFVWMSSWPAIVCFGTAALLEVGAYYIPVIDNLLDTIATPAAAIAGTILSASTLVHLDPTWQWILGAIVGGGSAGLIQAGSSMTRLLSTKTTVGTANHVLATGENTAALAGGLLAVMAPVVGAIIMLIVLIVGIWIVLRLFKRSRSTT